MTELLPAESQIHLVTSFRDLVAAPFHGNINAIGWTRKLNGDFSEIVNKTELHENMAVIEPEELAALDLSPAGQLAREILLEDFRLLKAHGASPVLNVISHYERDGAVPFFPTDVYSFHVDRSPVPTDTFLCTYYGAPSEIVPNLNAQQKVLIPAIRGALRKLYQGGDDGFEPYLAENFFDLHYMALPHAIPLSLGTGNLWRLAVDHPQSSVPPCIHRAPKEQPGEKRLLMIC